MKGRFHQAIVAAANSPPLESAVGFNRHRPFVAARAIFATTNTLELSLQRMKTAQIEHRDILDALKRGDATRAEFLMRVDNARTRPYTICE
jgi:DNA-binding GntR family transcriptional regulator